MNFVPCIAWVSRGKAASNPEKLQLSAEELKRIVNETKDLCNQKNSVEETEDQNFEESQQEEGVETAEGCVVSDDENDDFDARYNLDTYDSDDEENPLFTINDLAVHVDNHDDDYLTDQESESDNEEKENFRIKDSDNLLIVGHIEDPSSVLEIHVYNEDDDAFYVHHDIVLPSFPLALSWLDFHPSDNNPGNYVAVGDMTPVIKIWDLDVVDVLEPDFTLGKKSKKKKEKIIKKQEMKYHSDSVLSLSWNKQFRNLLASGSADSTVIVWDLEKATSLNQIAFHSNKVQAVEWHPSQNHFLLSGCTDGYVKLYDCRSTDESKSWKVDGEIEKVVWNITDSCQFFCSTDQGYINFIDMRNKKILKTFQAHDEAVTGLDISPLKPDLLVSASMDSTLKVWDLTKDFKMINLLNLKVGSIYTAKVAPDQELTIAAGGNNASLSLKVVNLAKDDEEFNQALNEDVKIKNKEKKLQISSKFNKNKVYDAGCSVRYEGNVNIKNEEKESKKPNKRKVYDTDSNVKYKGNLSTKSKEKAFKKHNKRKVYDTEG